MSADEIDAELLAMAGSDTDDDEADDEPALTQQIATSPASGQEAKQPPSRPRGVAQRVRGKGRRQRKQESEDEDGEASPLSAADALASDAMDQRDSGADAPASSPDQDAPLYPLEGQYLSHQDRAHIDSLPEIQREEILAERAHELIRRQQDLQLKRALADTKAAASKHHKRNAAAAELDDGRSSARTTRPKTDKVRTALDDLKEARQQKASGQRTTLPSHRDRDRTRRSPSRSSAPPSDRDADGESEVEWAEPSSSRKRDETPVELRDFERCRVGRSNFAKVCFYPKFTDAIHGCFCRVSIGVNKETGQNMYRMAQIKGFTEGKPYQMEGGNGKQFTTDVYAIVAHGSAEKPWPFLACSDGKFTDAEFDRYTSTLHKDNLRVPKKSFVVQKLDDIHNLLNTSWTEQTIQQKLDAQKAMQAKHDPANVFARRKADILKRKQAASEASDAEEMAKCAAELAALENRAANASLTNGSGANGKPAAVRTQRALEQDRLAQLNAKTRKTNTEAVRKAQIEERKKLQRAREEARKRAEEKRAAETAGKAAEAAAAAKKDTLLGLPRDEMADLFGSDVSRTGTPVNGAGTPKRSRAGTPLALKRERERSGLVVVGEVGRSRRGLLDEEVIGGLDLGIDIEI